MKFEKNHKKVLSVAIGLLAGVAVASAQTTSYSDVVGYTTTVIKGSANGSSGSYFNFVPVQLAKASVFTGQATVSGTTVNLNGASLGALNLPHYLIVQSGTGSGYVSDITANTANTVTTAVDLSAQIGSGAQVSVIPHVLLSDVLGTGGTLVIAGGAAGTADLVYLVGADGSFKSYYYKTGLGAGWKDAGTGAAANSVAVYPNESILVERKASADTSGIIQSGFVAASDAKSVYTPGFNTAASGYPTSINLTALTSVIQGGSAATADQVYLVDSSTGMLKAFYYKTGLGAGWKDASSGVAADVTQDIGNGFVVERKQASQAVLSQTRPF